jgi:hypothetical protein
MPRRLLNVASIVCLVLCVALMGMWVRSYHVWDVLHGYYAGNHKIRVESRLGRVFFASQYLDSIDRATFNERPKWWTIIHIPITNQDSQEWPRPLDWGNSWGFWATSVSWTTPSLTVPYWFLALSTGALAMLFQLRWPWRFSLRTMLIATTIVAVVLGMIAWLDRAWIGK